MRISRHVRSTYLSIFVTWKSTGTQVVPNVGQVHLFHLFHPCTPVLNLYYRNKSRCPSSSSRLVPPNPSSLAPSSRLRTSKPLCIHFSCFPRFPFALVWQTRRSHYIQPHVSPSILSCSSISITVLVCGFSLYEYYDNTTLCHPPTVPSPISHLPSPIQDIQGGPPRSPDKSQARFPPPRTQPTPLVSASAPIHSKQPRCQSCF